MSMATGYRGVAGGSVQTAYTDQPGVAVAGMLAFASDIILADALSVSETDGVAAGRAVVSAALTDTLGLQNPPESVEYPGIASAVADIKGIVVFEENMQTDENGLPGWGNGRMARVLRPGRQGGRIWVATRADGAASAKVYIVTAVGTQTTYKLGDLCAVASSGDATIIDASTILKWVTAPKAGGFAMVETL